MLNDITFKRLDVNNQDDKVAVFERKKTVPSRVKSKGSMHLCYEFELTSDLLRQRIKMCQFEGIPCSELNKVYLKYFMVN